MTLTELAYKPNTKLTVADTQPIRIKGRVVTAYYGEDGHEYECASQRGVRDRWFRLDAE